MDGLTSRGGGYISGMTKYWWLCNINKIIKWQNSEFSKKNCFDFCQHIFRIFHKIINKYCSSFFSSQYNTVVGNDIFQDNWWLTLLVCTMRLLIFIPTIKFTLFDVQFYMFCEMCSHVTTTQLRCRRVLSFTKILLVNPFPHSQTLVTTVYALLV